jgi:cyclophilin family peptidyl-prolyl cis-trans isomerase/FKBP-type peptidyl-prolyl cis-trans isomerase
MIKPSLLAASALLAVACGATPEIRVNNQDIKVGDGLYALFETSKGDILIQLEMEKAPITVANFVALAEGTHPQAVAKKGEAFFDGLIFHRVIPQFMIQGGDPDGRGTGGPGYQFPDEFHPTLRHSGPGILSMANSGPGTNGSQFFITEIATPWLDDRHSVFGKVISGIEKVTEIANVERDPRDMPKTPITMKVKIIRQGKAAKEFDAPKVFTEGVAGAQAKAAKAAEEAAAKGAARAADFTWYTNETVNSAEFEKKYAEWVAKAESRADGLKVLVVTEGEGEPMVSGDEALVHYAGYLNNGKPFDSSVKEIAKAWGQYNPQREPYEGFPVQCGNQGRVIKGWQEGLIGLKKGSHAKLIIPPALGYGEAGAGGVIPPNATLVFDVWIENIVKH